MATVTTERGPEPEPVRPPLTVTIVLTEAEAVRLRDILREVELHGGPFVPEKGKGTLTTSLDTALRHG